jgi:hypothetical protein
VRGQLDRERAGHADDGGLRGGVGRSGSPGRCRRGRSRC